MEHNTEIIAKIKELSLSVTKNNYDSKIQEGYLLLKKLHDLKAEKDSIYNTLVKYYTTLPDNVSSDFIADILDFVCGWCSAQYHIWRE